ncbi:hypothetical protein FQN60_015211, partial [Etheostoma spectabile]
MEQIKDTAVALMHIVEKVEMDEGEEWTDVLQRRKSCRSTMKDGIANNSTASISHARKAVEQLKMEACMDRIK